MMAVSQFIAGLFLLGTALAAGTPAPQFAPELTVMLKHEQVAEFGSIQSRLENEVLQKYGAKLKPMFTFDENDVYKTPKLQRYYTVQNAKEAEYNKIIQELRKMTGSVETAYLTPPTSLPVVLKRAVEPETLERRQFQFPTPLLENRQGYLRPAALGGLDGDYAKTVPGGTGNGIRVWDCEGGWLKQHEDLLVNFPELLGTNYNDPDFQAHGTATAGVVGGDVNNFGIVGFVPDALFYGSGDIFPGEPGATFPFVNSPALAIRNALRFARPGDVILLEEQRPWTGLPLVPNPEPNLPIEWWPQDFDIIQVATGNGIVVIEAAGNGFTNRDVPNVGQNLNDDFLANSRLVPPPGEPSVPDTFPFGNLLTHPNPFTTTGAEANSGAVLVGAGAAPNSLNGPNRARLSFSNYGSRIDVQGWGENIFTTTVANSPKFIPCDGYGTPSDVENFKCYTRSYGGTSGASAIIAGVAASVQGTLKAKGLRPLTSNEFRALFRLDLTGDPQVDNTIGGRPITQRIGSRPDLRKLIPFAERFVRGAIPTPPLMANGTLKSSM